MCNYHFNQPIGTSGLSFALVDRKSFSDRLRGAGPEGAERLWAITREVITHVHDVLKHDLCCDELALLPETQSLIPVFQVLIQYPQLRTEQKYRSLLAWVTILLLLAEPNTRDVLHWSSRIQQESGAAFHQFPLLLRELAGRVKTRLHKDNVLAEASSIQNRYVLLLYWLLRRDGARDFSYRNVTSGKLLDRIGHERLLEKAARPEKQHIIPFSRLMRKLGDPDARRGSSHRFNNIGNLTYISHELNHYEAGLGDRFIDLEHDSREPAALRAHHLWDTNPAGTVQDLYLRARRLFGEEEPASREQAEKLYEEFCRRRRSLIRDALSRWLEELEAETFGALRVKDLGELEALGRGDARLESATPMFVPTRELRPDQRVRLFDYENPVEDELVAFLRSLPRRSIVPMDHALEVKLTDKKHVWLRLNRDRVSIFFHNRIDKGLQGEILAVLGMEDGESVVYQPGSERTDRLEKLGATRDRAQALKEKIEQSILDHVPLPAPKTLNFLEKWENRIGTSAVDDLRRFRKRFESLQDLQPKVLTDKKQKPLFALQLGKHPFHVFMPRNFKPCLRENFKHPSIKQAGALDAVKLFKQRLLDVQLADAYGKGSTIEIPIRKALGRFEELSGYLKDLASGLPSPSDAGGKSKNTGGKWNEETFFASARQHLKDPAVFERTRKLYEFMLDHGRVDFGTGREYASLTYKVGPSLAKSGCVSVLTVWAHGSMTFRTGNIQRKLGKGLAEYFCDQLTDLQATKGWHKKDIFEGYGPTAPLQEVFRDDESLGILKEAILHFLGEAEKMLQRNA